MNGKLNACKEWWFFFFDSMYFHSSFHRPEWCDIHSILNHSLWLSVRAYFCMQCCKCCFFFWSVRVIMIHSPFCIVSLIITTFKWTPHEVSWWWRIASIWNLCKWTFHEFGLFHVVLNLRICTEAHFRKGEKKDSKPSWAHIWTGLWYPPLSSVLLMCRLPAVLIRQKRV